MESRFEFPNSYGNLRRNAVFDGARAERFRDVRDLKAIFAANPRQLARNLLHQLTVYATGTPVRFSDRAEIEKMLDTCAGDGYRTRDLVHALVGSRVFLGES